MATHSSTLAWRSPWTEEPGGLQSVGCKEADRTVTAHIRSTLGWARPWFMALLSRFCSS